ncbi:MAG: PRC-barrel domain-containing protein [Clostridia bacterium]|nr:PRC-barrel domain-containing protein [Clostridia bacterium]
MYCCNELNSLCVLSLYEGELIGNVNKLYFDKKLKKLMSLEIIGENDAKFLLPTKNIYHIGKNAITIKNNLAINLKVEESNLSVCPIGAKAYTIRGEYLGIIKEVSLNEKFLTDKFSLDNGNLLSASNLASCGKNTVIFFDNEEKINIQKFIPCKAPKVFKTEGETQSVTTLPVEEKVEEKSTVIVEFETSTSNMQNNEFLLGRICTKDIFNFNNELLIKAHTIINKKHLKEVNKFGKLRELMLFSK